ncbi:hypothetical protein [Nocardioides sp. Kera G14]|uniref:hypothetical protein n=1 Tax=Nocardioides sp. Kera G14 TaxID=2884264 RepID=UPI001D12BA34|nr:hypothetical protein [Nocardioides sp. Kera G14]UDY22984.1 hypothetical protein LH076_13045 [Nocardioides sp. Kera G14]
MTYERNTLHVDMAEVWEKAYKQALTTAPGEQAEYLLRTIGPRVASAALGLADARQLKAWSRGETVPREHAVLGRLSLLYRVAYAIAETQGGTVAALFLRSSNPQLDDEVPLMVLRKSDSEEVQGRLLAATRAFLEG